MFLYAKIVVFFALASSTLLQSSSGFSQETLVLSAAPPITVHPVFDRCKKALLKMMDFSYTVANFFHYPEGYHQSPKEHFEQLFYAERDYFDKEWQIIYLHGKSGIDSEISWHKRYYATVPERDDTPGFIAVHKQESIIAIVFHGSHSYQCWKTNFDIDTIDGKKTGHRGKLHRGFALKYASVQANYHRELDRALTDLIERNPGETIRVFFAGHSHGAGLAQLAIGNLSALARYLKDVGQLLAGGWFLSAPKVFLDDEGVAAIKAQVGELNLIFQDCDGDPIPKQLTTIREKLSELFTWNGWAAIKDHLAQLFSSDALELGVQVKQMVGKKFQKIGSLLLTAVTAPSILYPYLASKHFGEKNPFGDYLFSEDMVDLDAFSGPHAEG